LDLKAVEDAISLTLEDITRQKELFRKWTEIELDNYIFDDWINETIAKSWGIKAACRVYHICNKGWDVELTMPFERCPPTKKSVKQIKKVPGAPAKAKNYYDVAQALAWVATNRNDAEERSKWQAEIAGLMVGLEAFAYYPDEPVKDSQKSFIS
jgi:hypothetical protein